jgi:hypothetical protein
MREKPRHFLVEFVIRARAGSGFKIKYQTVTERSATVA